MELKKLLEKHPGTDDVELVIGQKVLPLPIKVSWTDELKSEVSGMVDKY